MILKVPADTGKVGSHGDTQPLQLVGGPDTRMEQEERGPDGAGTEDDLLRGRDDLCIRAMRQRDPSRSATLDRDVPHQRVGPEGEVGALEDGLQEGVGRTVAMPVPDRALEQTDAEETVSAVSSSRERNSAISADCASLRFSRSLTSRSCSTRAQSEDVNRAASLFPMRGHPFSRSVAV